MRSERGFSLLEVVVALAVLGLAAGLLGEAVHAGFLGVRKSAGLKMLLAAAEARLAGAGLEQKLEAGTSEGVDGHVRWRLAIEEFREPLGTSEFEPDAAPRAFRVRVTVSAAGAPRSLSLETIRLAPRPTP